MVQRCGSVVSAAGRAWGRRGEGFEEEKEGQLSAFLCHSPPHEACACLPWRLESPGSVT